MGLILIAVGAILLWAVNWHTTVVNINTVGAILLVVGLVLGLFEAFFYTRFYSHWRRDTRDYP